VVFVALEQLAIGTALLTAAFQIGFGAIGLAFALAFGLGGREWAAGVIKKLTGEVNRIRAGKPARIIEAARQCLNPAAFFAPS